MSVTKRYRLGVLAVWFVAACGYSVGFKPREFVAQNGERRPIRSIAVPVFENRSLRRELEFPLTEAVLREIQRRTPLFVTSPDRADVTLKGTIESFDQVVLVRGPRDTALEEGATVAVGVTATDRASNELFCYTNDPRRSATRTGPAILESQQFASGPGGESLDRPTTDAFRNLAERVVMLLEQRMGPAQRKP